MRRNRFHIYSQHLEWLVAAIVFIWPLLYLITYFSADPIFWRYSSRVLLAIILYSVFYIGFLTTYRWALWSWLKAARSLVVMALASVIASLVIAETLLQWRDNTPYEATDNSGRHAPDPDVGHIYYPNVQQVLQEREWRQMWRSNSQGVRANRDYGPKPSDTYRILVIGDSFTVGDQVRLEQTYPGVLQQRFDARFGDRRVEVINAGYPGYGTANEARWLQKFGQSFEPNLVILGMTPNDLGENLCPLCVVARNGALARRHSSDQQRRKWEDQRRWHSVPGLINRSLLYQRLRATPLIRQLTLGYIYSHRHAYTIDLDREASKRYKLAEQYLLEARNAAHSMGAYFAFVIIPFREQLSDLRPGLDPAIFGQRFTAFGGAQNIPSLDLLSTFRAHPKPASLYWREDSHCTAEGYALIGNSIFDFLMQMGSHIGLHELASRDK